MRTVLLIWCHDQGLVEENLLRLGLVDPVRVGILAFIARAPVEACDRREINHGCISERYTFQANTHCRGQSYNASGSSILPQVTSATIVALMRTELVTTLKRQATELLSDIERDKQPILITQHGLPSAYLVDVETFELLQQRMAVLEGIARGEMAVAEGRVVSHAEAKIRMARWLK